MAKGFKHGPGGTSLNFSVKAFPSEEELLAATPKENTIGIITTVPIPSWSFRDAQPETPVEGMVWFPTGTNGKIELNALKKNEVALKPLSAKQYVSGAWKNVDAQNYTGGQWLQFSNEWNGELYETNNEHTDITGGWKGSATIAANGVVTLSGTTAVGDNFYTAKKIEKGTATKLYVNVPSLTKTNGVLNIMATRTNDGTAADEGKVYAFTEITGTGKHYVPLSGITAPFYVYFYTYNNITAKIDKVWME